ncbi:hypothetical protein DFJ73DRAFT_902384 [Zopfochytrium polystomum]|nr:hypothetical protein DFJ73DRAFT_902384 [Zopfochytrium polystomum]
MLNVGRPDSAAHSHAHPQPPPPPHTPAAKSTTTFAFSATGGGVSASSRRHPARGAGGGSGHAPSPPTLAHGAIVGSSPAALELARQVYAAKPRPTGGRAAARPAAGAGSQSSSAVRSAAHAVTAAAAAAAAASAGAISSFASGGSSAAADSRQFQPRVSVVKEVVECDEEDAAAHAGSAEVTELQLPQTSALNKQIRPMNVEAFQSSVSQSFERFSRRLERQEADRAADLFSAFLTDTVHAISRYFSSNEPYLQETKICLTLLHPPSPSTTPTTPSVAPSLHAATRALRLLATLLRDRDAALQHLLQRFAELEEESLLFKDVLRQLPGAPSGGGGGGGSGWGRASAGGSAAAGVQRVEIVVRQVVRVVGGRRARGAVVDCCVGTEADAGVWPLAVTSAAAAASASAVGAALRPPTPAVVVVDVEPEAAPARATVQPPPQTSPALLSASSAELQAERRSVDSRKSVDTAKPGLPAAAVAYNNVDAGPSSPAPKPPPKEALEPATPPATAVPSSRSEKAASAGATRSLSLQGQKVASSLSSAKADGQAMPVEERKAGSGSSVGRTTGKEDVVWRAERSFDPPIGTNPEEAKQFIASADTQTDFDFSSQDGQLQLDVEQARAELQKAEEEHQKALQKMRLELDQMKTAHAKALADAEELHSAEATALRGVAAQAAAQAQEQRRLASESVRRAEESKSAAASLERELAVERAQREQAAGAAESAVRVEAELKEAREELSELRSRLRSARAELEDLRGRFVASEQERGRLAVASVDAEHGRARMGDLHNSLVRAQEENEALMVQAEELTVAKRANELRIKELTTMVNTLMRYPDVSLGMLTPKLPQAAAAAGAAADDSAAVQYDLVHQNMINANNMRIALLEQKNNEYRLSRCRLC